MATKSAIVSTIKEPGATIIFFIKYHLEIGFDHIFLFFDSPDDPAISDIKNFEKVTIILNDSSLKERWRKSKLFKDNPDHVHFLNTEVMARQIMNAAIAIDMASHLGIEWILHIDYDELFYISQGTVNDHFHALSQKGIQSIRYLNHEGVPEKMRMDNFFEEVTLFKRNPFLLSRAQRKILKIDVNNHFLYYANGKSAGKVGNDLIPNSVHDFKFQRMQDVTSDPCIYHFPVCGLDNFIKKYKILGNFNDKWFGHISITQMAPFHLKARDIVAVDSGDYAKDFYCKNVLANPDETKLYLENGIYFRNSFTVN